MGIVARTANKTTYKHVETAVFGPLFDDLLAASAGPSSSNVHASTALDEEDSADEEEGRSPKRPRVATQELGFLHLCSSCALDAAALSESALTGIGTASEPVAPGPLRRALLARLFEVASAPETRDANRRKMYAFWKVAKAEDDDDEDEE